MRLIPSITITRIAKVRIGRLLAAGTWLLFLFSSAWICHSCYYGSTFISLGKSTRVIMPPGYEGPVLLIWNVPGGQIPEMKDGGRLRYYRLQEDGALPIADPGSSPHPFGLPFLTLRGTLTFWHDLPGPYMQYLSNKCPRDASDQGVGLCAKGIGPIYVTSNNVLIRQRPFQSYTVTTYEDRDVNRAKLEELRSTYYDVIHYPPERLTP